MKTLASDVGGLKKVLSNVKMRGGIGEIQLEMLLEQILAPDQYEANVKTKETSSDSVEFAIKLPGKDDEGSIVWLPIDAKFPKDIYGAVVGDVHSETHGGRSCGRRPWCSVVRLIEVGERHRGRRGIDRQRA